MYPFTSHTPINWNINNTHVMVSFPPHYTQYTVQYVGQIEFSHKPTLILGVEGCLKKNWSLANTVPLICVTDSRSTAMIPLKLNLYGRFLCALVHAHDSKKTKRFIAQL